MIDIGIIGAMEVEVNDLVSRLENGKCETVSGIDFHTGKMLGKEVAIAKCGIGKVFAAMAAEVMILKYAPKLLVNTGVGGALAHGLRRGDIVVAEKLCQHDMDTSPIGDPVGLLSGINIVNIKTDEKLLQALITATKQIGIEPVVGTVASGDQFIATDAQKQRIRTLFNAAACEMEGASIGHVAYVNNLPFAVLRAISDGGDGMEFSKFVDLAAARSVTATKEFVQLI